MEKVITEEDIKNLQDKRDKEKEKALKLEQKAKLVQEIKKDKARQAAAQKTINESGGMSLPFGSLPKMDWKIILISAAVLFGVIITIAKSC